MLTGEICMGQIHRSSWAPSFVSRAYGLRGVAASTSVGAIIDPKLAGIPRSHKTPHARYRPRPVASRRPSSETRFCAARGVMSSSLAIMTAFRFGHRQRGQVGGACDPIGPIATRQAREPATIAIDRSAAEMGEDREIDIALKISASDEASKQA
jgi:hypothetical protein